MNVQSFSHIPVLAKETTELLAVKDGLYFDGTIGMAGHSRLLLEARAGISIFGTDIDKEMADIAADKLKTYGSRAKIVCANYANASAVLKENGINSLAGVLLDLGVSSLHYDKTSRGFAFKEDGPLDMRLNQSSKLTAEELVNDWPANQLEKMLYSCGEVNGRRIVRAIEKARAAARITSTAKLAELIANIIPARAGHAHPATKTFMALRIFVNDEFENIKKGIQSLVPFVENGGRFALITFHSTEDRLVKNIFSEFLLSGKWKRVNTKSIKPADEEIEANPRARSAQLRVFERV